MRLLFFWCDEKKANQIDAIKYLKQNTISLLKVKFENGELLLLFVFLKSKCFYYVCSLIDENKNENK